MTYISIKQIEESILIIRDQRVLLDSELAKIYGVTTKRLNEQVRRNRDRFPQDFMFQLNEVEVSFLRSQSATSKGRGGRRYLPFAFTEHGILMLANVLTSETAIGTSIKVIRAFKHLREMVISHVDLSRRLDSIEKQYDSQFKVVFDAIKQLMIPPDLPKRRIGIRNDG
jgi:phage regulator Rha-like protein